MIELFNTIFVNPILNVLVAVYQVLVFLHIPSPLGFSIIILTILIRFLLYPLIRAQLTTSMRMQDLSPLLTKLKEQYKNQPQRIQQETLKLYKQYGVNPAAGCLPVLIQLPVIWALYSVLQNVVKYTSTSQVNEHLYSPFLKLTKLWDLHFFGIPLLKTPFELINTYSFLIVLIPLLTGLLQYYQSKMMFGKPKTAPSTDLKKKPEVKSIRPAQDKKEPDFATVFQKQSLYIFPIMIAFFSFQFPVGLSLYWNTFSVFGIIQQKRMQNDAKGVSLVTTSKKVERKK